jgi:hypothetical protein
MGPEFPYAVRVGSLISNLVIILTMSAGLPLLYPCGLFIVIVQFWSDKIAFFRLYKQPPLFDGKIVTIIPNALWWGILGHIFFGFFMFSNGPIFGAAQTSTSEAAEYDLDVTRSDLYNAPHVVFFLYCSGILVILMILEEVTGLIGKIMKCLCCCCYYTVNDDEKEAKSFSRNIYDELDVNDLEREYDKAENEMKYIAKIK